MIVDGYTPEEHWPLHDHDPAPFYYKDNVVMMGDAAHATFPFVGNGAAQALEDGAVLHALFTHVKHKSQIRAAFVAFDEVRRPRAQRVVEMSRQFGLMYNYEFGGMWEEGEDVEKLKAYCRKMADFTNDADLVTQNKLALEAFYTLIGAHTNGVSGGS